MRTDNCRIVDSQAPQFCPIRPTSNACVCAEHGPDIRELYCMLTDIHAEYQRVRALYEAARERLNRRDASCASYVPCASCAPSAPCVCPAPCRQHECACRVCAAARDNGKNGKDGKNGKNNKERCIDALPFCRAAAICPQTLACDGLMTESSSTLRFHRVEGVCAKASGNCVCIPENGYYLLQWKVMVTNCEGESGLYLTRVSAGGSGRSVRLTRITGSGRYTGMRVECLHKDDMIRLDARFAAPGGYVEVGDAELLLFRLSCG